MDKKRVALLTNIIAPYRVPAFNKIAELAPFDFDVYFMAENESNRNWEIYKEKIKFKYKVLKGVHFNLKNRFVHLNFGLSYYLIKNKVVAESQVERDIYYKDKYVVLDGYQMDPFNVEYTQFREDRIPNAVCKAVIRLMEKSI